MLTYNVPWTVQPRGPASVAGRGVGWLPDNGPGRKYDAPAGVIVDIGSTATTVIKAPFVANKTFTFIGLVAPPAGSLADTEILRIGGASDGVRIQASTGTTSITAQWVANGVATCTTDIYGTSGTTGEYPRTPIIVAASCTPTTITTWIGEAGQKRTSGAGARVSRANTVSMVAPTNFGVQLKSVSVYWYGLVVLPYAVGADEFAKIFDNPWRIFQKRRNATYFGAAAAGGSFQPAWAYSSTQILGSGTYCA